MGKQLKRPQLKHLKQRRWGLGIRVEHTRVGSNKKKK